jgi:transcriptional regulator with XRE-family HTH domain
MVDDPAPNEIQQLLAANLRRLRIARHFSLSELARATGISKATLSGIENARANPTVDTLAALADAMRISLIELLEELPPGEMRVVRASARRSERVGGVPVQSVDLLSGRGDLAIGEIALGPGELHELEPQASGARGQVYVLQGKLIAGPAERSTELGPGDYASFPTDVPTIYEAGRGAVRALVLLQAPG